MNLMRYYVRLKIFSVIGVTRQIIKIYLKIHQVNDILQSWNFPDHGDII